MHFVFTKRKVFNFAVSILKLVPPTRIELVMTGYQPIVIPFNYRGISGGKGEIRTHTGHRMKVLHNHYATLPYRNTLGYLPIYLGILFRKMCFYMVGALRIELRLPG